MQKKNKNVTFLKFFSIFFLPPPGVVSEDFFLIQLICRKKIKKEIFLQVFFSIFAGHFLPLFVHLSKQQKKAESHLDSAVQRIFSFSTKS